MKITYAADALNPRSEDSGLRETVIHSEDEYMPTNSADSSSDCLNIDQDARDEGDLWNHESTLCENVHRDGSQESREESRSLIDTGDYNNHGDALASIHSSDKAGFVVSRICNRRDIWIGLALGIQTGWRYGDGSAVNYLYWAQGEPRDNFYALLASLDCVVAR